MRTMWEAPKIGLPITIMTFAVFTRSDMVVNPGWPQLAATGLVLVGTCGAAFAMFGRFLENSAGNALLRATLALFAFVTLFHPDNGVATAAGAVTLAATAYGVLRHRRIASPKGALEPQPAS